MSYVTAFKVIKKHLNPWNIPQLHDIRWCTTQQMWVDMNGGSVISHLMWQYLHTSALGISNGMYVFKRQAISYPDVSAQYEVSGACASSLWFGLNAKKHNMWLWSYSDVTAALLLILEECLWLVAVCSTSLPSLSNKTQAWISTAMDLYKPHCMACQRNIYW